MSWADHRRRMEADIVTRGVRHGVFGPRYHPSGRGFITLMRVLLTGTGLWWNGKRNGRDVRVNRVDLEVRDLPAAFEGFTLLFFSDLHVNVCPENLDTALRWLPDLHYDLAILGGDYQSWGEPSEGEALDAMAPLLAALTARGIVLGVMGNHDRHPLAAGLSSHGVHMLVNDHWMMERGGARMVVTGLDDVHSFHTPAAPAALAACPQADLRLAVVHSPEMACEAANAGYQLYLAGHTHGGQVCLPSGKPLWVPGDRHLQLALGPWRYHGMAGYTSTGLGNAAPPIRINSRPELALLTLRQAASP